MASSGSLADADASQMRWWGWGDPQRAPTLSSTALARLAEALGEELTPMPPVAFERVAIEGSRLSDAAAGELRGVLGDARVRTDRSERILHAAGKGYLDLVRLRDGEPGETPDAVLHPHTEDELRALLSLCGRHRLAVVPFGGGTSVVGGVSPLRGNNDAVLCLDLRGLASMQLDRESETVTVGAGLRAATLERSLAAQGLTLGHFPQSYEYVSLGGCAATRSAGQASSGYGRFAEMVLGLRLIAPAGEIETLSVPASAAGPDLRQLIVGSEGALGVIGSLTLRLRRAPAVQRYEAYLFEELAAGESALRELAQAGPLPTLARLSDAAETEITLRLSAGHKLVDRLTSAYLDARSGPGRCLAILGFEGGEQQVSASSRAANELARRCGALRLGVRGGAAWLSQRFAGPYLRDELMTHGVMVETLETATSWSNLRRLREGVTGAIGSALQHCGTRGLVGCHISHVYPSGASLYFTFLAPRLAGQEESQWRVVKEAACEAIVDGGGTISHHHGVGVDHARWLQREIGADGMEALRACKQQLDPDSVMNPGKLLSSA